MGGDPPLALKRGMMAKKHGLKHPQCWEGWFARGYTHTPDKRGSKPLWRGSSEERDVLHNSRYFFTISKIVIKFFRKKCVQRKHCGKIVRDPHCNCARHITSAPHLVSLCSGLLLMYRQTQTSYCSNCLLKSTFE